MVEYLVVKIAVRHGRNLLRLVTTRLYFFRPASNIQYSTAYQTQVIISDNIYFEIVCIILLRFFVTVALPKIDEFVHVHIYALLPLI